jgi:hypothetical protein
MNKSELEDTIKVEKQPQDECTAWQKDDFEVGTTIATDVLDDELVYIARKKGELNTYIICIREINKKRFNTDLRGKYSS